MNIVLIIIAAIIGGMRVEGFKDIAFQAVAHLFVGAMIGSAAVGSGMNRKIYIGIAVGLSITEIICFLFMKP